LDGKLWDISLWFTIQKYLTMTIQIKRLDYKNQDPIFKTYEDLPTLNNVNDITDINEIHSISIHDDSEANLDFYLSKFPKSMKVKKGTMSSNGSDITGSFLYKAFNTFWTDGTTGSKNETAAKHREKFIDILKDLY
jgi:hypothetical protein